MDTKISDRKLAANRENARRSTGPRTAHGKKVSAANSLVHGLFARTAIIAGPPFFEDPLEFLRLWEGIRIAFVPIGIFECTTVEKIALVQWYEARVARYLAAVTNGQLQDALAGNGRIVEAEELEGDLSNDELDQRAVAALKADSAAVSAQLNFVLRLISGTVTDDDDLFLLHIWESAVRKGDSQTSGRPQDWRTQAKSHLVALTSAERVKLIEEIKALALETLNKAESVHSKNVAMDVALERSIIPEEAELNKIMRYSSHLAREEKHLIEQLMMLQEARRKRESRIE